MPARKDIRKVMIIGSGPIIIGQACEFDYSGTQACKALRKLGYDIVLVNSNPATIMTDPGMADYTYIEPLNVAAMTISFTVARFARLGDRQATAIAMELGVHNSTVAITVATAIDVTIAIPAAVYSMFMFITAGGFARVMARRNGDPAPAPATG